MYRTEINPDTGHLVMMDALTNYSPEMTDSVYGPNVTLHVPGEHLAAIQAAVGPRVCEPVTQLPMDRFRVPDALVSHPPMQLNSGCAGRLLSGLLMLL